MMSSNRSSNVSVSIGTIDPATPQANIDEINAVIDALNTPQARAELGALIGRNVDVTISTKQDLRDKN